MHLTKIKQVAAAAFMLVGVLGLTGCESTPATGEIMKRMDEALSGKDIQATQSTFHMKYVPENGAEIEMDLLADRICDLVQKKNKTDLKLELKADDSKEEASDIQYLLDASGEETVSYVHWNNSWSAELEAESSDDLEDLIRSTIKDYKDVMIVSSNTMKADDVDCYELTAVLAPMDLNKILTYVAEEIPDGAYGEVDRAAVIPLNHSAQLTLLVDVESFLPRAITLGTNVFDSELTLAIRMDFTYPERAEIVIPQEAVDAIPVEEPEGSMDLLLPQLPESAQVLKEFDAGEYMVCENGSIRVCLLRLAKTAADTLKIDLELVNESTVDADIYTERTAVNSTMFDNGLLYQHVKKGETMIATVEIPDLSAYGITDIGSVSLQIAADRSTDNSELISGELKTFVLHHGMTGYHIPEGEDVVLIYEDENLRISAGAVKAEAMSESVPLYIENISSHSCSVTTDTITDEQGAPVNARIYGDLLPRSCVYTNLVLNRENILLGSSDFPAEVHFRLNGYDLDAISTLFTTKEIVITLPAGDEGAESETEEPESLELSETEALAESEEMTETAAETTTE